MAKDSLEVLLAEARRMGFVCVSFSMNAADNTDCALSAGIGGAQVRSCGVTPAVALHAAIAALRRAGKGG